MEEKYLPLGSVVILGGGKKELMITGYCMETPEKPGKIFDYCGCIFPEGVIRSDLTCVFDHAQIEKIIFTGCKNERAEKFLTRLKERTNSKEKKDLPVIEEIERL